MPRHAHLPHRSPGYAVRRSGRGNEEGRRHSRSCGAQPAAVDPARCHRGDGCEQCAGGLRRWRCADCGHRGGRQAGGIDPQGRRQWGGVRSRPGRPQGTDLERQDDPGHRLRDEGTGARTDRRAGDSSTGVGTTELGLRRPGFPRSVPATTQPGMGHRRAGPRSGARLDEVLRGVAQGLGLGVDDRRPGGAGGPSERVPRCLCQVGTAGRGAPEGYRQGPPQRGWVRQGHQAGGSGRRVRHRRQRERIQPDPCRVRPQGLQDSGRCPQGGPEGDPLGLGSAWHALSVGRALHASARSGPDGPVRLLVPDAGVLQGGRHLHLPDHIHPGQRRRGRQRRRPQAG